MHKGAGNSTQEYRQELRSRILRTAMPMFKRNGIRAVRMDDIAQLMQISKRTIYELYGNKEELLLECVKMDADTLHRRVTEYAMTAENELDVVVTFFRLKFDDLGTVTPQFLSDMEGYTLAKRYLSQLREEQQKGASAFMRTCVEKGFFIPRINYDLLQELCDMVMTTAINNRMHEKYTIQDIFRNFFMVLLRGFCTEKGLALLDQYLKKASPGDCTL